MKSRETTRVGLGVLMAFLAGGTATAQDRVPQGRLARQLVVDGVRRDYVVHVPARVNGTRAVPVVFMIHGTSGSGDKFYNISGWVEKADREGFIAVFPSALAYCLGDDDDHDGQISEREYVITTKWSAGQLGTPAMPLCTDEQLAGFAPARRAEVESRTARDDVAFFRAMVEALRAELPVDPRRMYVSGFSNGAQMSGRLLVEMSDTFAAFAMAAGGLVVPGPALRPAPVVFSVGSLDDRYLAVTGLRELPYDASMVDVPIFQGLAVRLASAVGIDPNVPTYQLRVFDGAMVGQVTLDHSLVGAGNVVIFAVIEGATHQYPNGTNHPVVMADQLWPFFSLYTLP